MKACRPTSSRLHKNGWTPLTDNPVSPTFLLSVSEGFDDEIVDLFGSAFEAAWQSLQLSDSRLTHEPHVASTRELLAKWILVLGKQRREGSQSACREGISLACRIKSGDPSILHSGKFDRGAFPAPIFVEPSRN